MIFLRLRGAEATGEEIDLVPAFRELTAPAPQNIKAGRISEMSKLGHGGGGWVKQNTYDGKGNTHLCPHTKITLSIQVGSSTQALNNRSQAPVVGNLGAGCCHRRQAKSLPPSAGGELQG